jgi:hypothetical protein
VAKWVMFVNIFFTLIRIFVVPAGAILVLSNTFVGYQMGFLGVCIILTVLVIPTVIWQTIKILPNLALIRTKEVAKLAVDIVLEIVAMIAFWVVYLSIFP